MTHTTILSWVTFIYFAAFVFYLFRTVFGKTFWGRLATMTAWVGLAVQSCALVWRWKLSYDLGIGHIPLSNLYESMVFFAWSIVFLYLILEWKAANRVPGAFVIPVAFLAMAYASIAPGVDNNIQPLIPALQSNWLTSHVVTCFLGYASFTLAFGSGLIYFIHPLVPADKDSPDNRSACLPSPDTLDTLIYQGVVLGFVFLSMGILTGSVWAHFAWGSYWSWDPKETWSLITWIIYAIMLHARLVRGWRGKRMAVMAVIGFASVLFTYLGVNYLPGLHSYLNA
ncbi:c-type cytochrome biogenesis protein CcsB [Syntrophus aciditrophicus]|uniref:Heme export protein apocytochrome heme-lyase n=1 Tax=Syntrophus aciditrophicus (strain SB) TaxID=56780 RepID=Q2LYA7_SYNAS|nr:c-type cytochrome biogenesis protein CcsB [Syntrophus aciditrophicus]ABC75969.1 heme export protein apocytochrome heme-lyase [Syntrophus aciditrophicus SB]OPY14431.1 MAG: Cytochrome c biogenesis protein CcsA [Syntrophus sp. PtaB.Bin075]